jgi:hypothetical protein
MKTSRHPIRRSLAALTLCASFLVPAVHAQTGNGAATQTASDAIVKRLDPTDFNSRFEVRNEYQDLQGGGSINLLVPRLDYAVSSALSLRVETPVVSSDPGSAGNNGESGFGNLLLRASYRAVRGAGYAVVVGGELTLDTASKDTLGNGKDVFAPLAFGSFDLPGLRSVFFPFLQYYTSIGGDDARPDVHYTSIKTVLLTRWPDRFYTVVEPHFIIDHEHADRVGVTLEGEVGRFLDRNVALWARPGIGLHGDNLPQVYNWNFEVGFRYIFN